MFITKIYIANFGCLSNYEINFNKEINVLLEDNGKGKTTIANFIKAMFYGFNSTKKNVSENDRLHYAPWQGGKYGGSLEFAYQNKIYRIERTFGEKSATKDKFNLYDVKTNKESFDFDKNIGEKIFGIDAEGYSRSTYIPQSNDTWSVNNSITANLMNQIENSNDVNNFDKAINALKDKARIYEKIGNKGLIADVKNEITSLEIDLEEQRIAFTSISDIKNKINTYQEKLNTAKTNLNIVKEKIKKANVQKEKKAIFEHYQSLKQDLDKVNKEIKELEIFFQKYMPTLEELNQYERMYESYNNYQQQLITFSGYDSSLNEYLSLQNYFHINEKIPLPSLEQIDNLLIKNKEYQDILNQQEILSKEMDEITDQIANETISTSTHKAIFIVLIFLGMILVVTGVALLFTYRDITFATIIGIILTSGGAILSGIAIFLLLFSRNKQNARNKELLKKQQSLEAKRDLQGETYRTLETKGSSLNKELVDFIGTYEDLSNSTGLFIDIRNGKVNYDTFLNRISVNRQLMENHKKNQVEKSNKISSITSNSLVLEQQIKEFIAQFGFSSNYRYALTSILSNLQAYQKAKEEQINKTETLKAFLQEKNIDFSEKYESIDENLDIEQNSCEYTIEQTKENLEIKNKELNHMEELASKISDTETQIALLKENLATYEHKNNMINKTIDLLTIAKDNLAASYLTKIQKSFDQYLNLLLNDNKEFTYSSDLKISSNEAGSTKELEYYSTGYQDVVEFASRLAVVDSIFPKDAPVLILDDPFTNYDAKKLELAKALLNKLSKKYQIIYLICHESRKA